MTPVHLFQIHYTSPARVEPGFELLDNTANPRPDWYEYWPIRDFLLHQPLQDDAFYGFLSPKFALKTHLSAASVRDFIAAVPPATEVVLFSPSIHNSAFYFNVFEHGDADHPGLAGVALRVFERLGRPLDLDSFICDSRNTVYSNYFVAKPRFWRAWLDVAERVFAIAEAPDDALGRELRAATTYRGREEAQMKIFIIERIATWLLVTDPSFLARARDPFAARARFYKLPVAVACDALKIAYLTQGREQYKEVFVLVRNLRKFLNLQIRLGGWAAFGPVAPTLRALKAHWRG